LPVVWWQVMGPGAAIWRWVSYGSVMALSSLH
jgi:hypothetical protein